VQGLVESRVPSEPSDPRHPGYWVGVVGRVTQHSLLNPTGDTADYRADFNGQTQGKSFADSDCPGIEQLMACFTDRLHNFRINTLFPGAGLKPHEEPIVRDNLVCLRFHLPIFTNPGASLVLDEERFHFEPGIVYFFNKGCVHAVENLGDAPRYHLLWDLWLDEWVFETMFARGGSTTPHAGLHRIEAERLPQLCGSTPVEITEYHHGTASGAILRASRRSATEAFEISPVNFDPDIVPSDESITLSGPWHPLEHWAGDTFRWVSGAGGFTLLALEDGMERIQLELEPGAGVADLPLQLELVDQDGCELLREPIQGRQALEVAVPVHAGANNFFRIVARNGGRKVESDPRALDFRVFRIHRDTTRAE
jgi:hypothetical protein